MTTHAPLVWSVSIERDGKAEIVRVAARSRRDLDDAVISAQRRDFPNCEVRIVGARLVG